MVSSSFLPGLVLPPSLQSQPFTLSPVPFLSSFSLPRPFLCNIAMPVLDGLWGQDFRMQDSSLTVGVYSDEPPGSRVWGPLRTPPVTCGSLSLTLELPALIRQLRQAWTARRRGTQGLERSEGGTWTEAVQDEAKAVKQDLENSIAHLEGTFFLNYKCNGCHISDKYIMFNACCFNSTHRAP